jgi:hypothetical protein
MSPLLAQSGHFAAEFRCPLLGVKRTLIVAQSAPAAILGQAVLREKIDGKPRAFLWLLDLQEMSRALDKAVVVAALGAQRPVSGTS